MQAFLGIGDPGGGSGGAAALAVAVSGALSTALASGLSGTLSGGLPGAVADGRFVIEIAVVALGTLAAIGTLLSFSDHPHWLVRTWDFPRVQIGVVSAGCALVYVLWFLDGSSPGLAFVAACTLTTAWQLFKVLPYTPLAPVQVHGPERPDAPRLRLLISNVLMENREHGPLLDLIATKRPDVVLLVEIDDVWARAVEGLRSEYPHSVCQIQGNYYGMMLLSRFPLTEERVLFRVQYDIPSVVARIAVPGTPGVYLHGLHPRPPEALRDQTSAPRDAELVLVGREIREAGDRATVVAGDLNDVAWSATSQLFLRLSRLMDPRLGRGFFSSFPTHVPFLRCPLDHVFHSDHFRLVSLERQESIGSDHFPMQIELSYEPAGKSGQSPSSSRAGDEGSAADKLETESDAARTGDDRPSSG